MSSHHVCKTLFISLLIVLALASCGQSAPPSDETLLDLGMRPIPGERDAPNLQFADLDGSPRTLEDFRGSVVLLNFWASWCPPCRAEMPSMSRLAKKLKGKDFVMIPINVQEPVSLVTAFVQEFEVDFPVYLDEEAQAARTMGVAGLPTSILIDRDGKAIALATGAIEWDDEAVIAMFNNWMR